MTVTKEALTEGTKYLEDAPHTWKTGVCAGGVIGNDGHWLKDHRRGDICHYFIRPSITNATNYSLISSAQGLDHRSGHTEEADQAFMKYIVQQNPAGRFVVNRDDLSSVFEGGILIDAHAAGYNISLWLCKAMRYVNEERWRAPNWYKYVNAGVDPLVAMFACSCINSAGLVSPGNTHASVMTNPTTIEVLAKALSIDYFEDAGEYLSNRSESTSDVFGKRLVTYDEKGIIQIGKQQFKEVKVPDGWGGFIVKKEAVPQKDLIHHLKDLTQQAQEFNAGKKHDNRAAKPAKRKEK